MLSTHTYMGTVNNVDFLIIIHPIKGDVMKDCIALSIKEKENNKNYQYSLCPPLNGHVFSLPLLFPFLRKSLFLHYCGNIFE